MIHRRGYDITYTAPRSGVSLYFPMTVGNEWHEGLETGYIIAARARLLSHRAGDSYAGYARYRIKISKSITSRAPWMR